MFSVLWKSVAVLAVFALLSLVGHHFRSQPVAALVRCDAGTTLSLQLSERGRELDLQRPDLGSPWLAREPRTAWARRGAVESLLKELGRLKVLNTVQTPSALEDYGLDRPSLTIACAAIDGSSYTLSIGDPSFDGSGYYAQKAGDARVFVVSANQVEKFDLALGVPPLGPSSTPPGNF